MIPAKPAAQRAGTGTQITETMKRLYHTLRILLPAMVLPMLPATLHAQQAAAEAEPVSNPMPAAPRYGYCSHRQLLEGMAEYAQATAQLKSLREKYEREARHNEEDFRRRFQEYLQGQKDFPKAILLKRQSDLERSMEEGLAFREQADSLLEKAEYDLLTPLKNRIDATIIAVGKERGYECVVNTDAGVFPYLNPTLSEDITNFVREKLKGQ